ncbi:hypothetical protein MRX96_023653 [Rhipicephalus microplus]
MSVLVFPQRLRASGRIPFKYEFIHSRVGGVMDRGWGLAEIMEARPKERAGSERLLPGPVEQGERAVKARCRGAVASLLERARRGKAPPLPSAVLERESRRRPAGRNERRSVEPSHVEGLQPPLIKGLYLGRACT